MPGGAISSETLRLLVIEPYLGGSHASFIRGLKTLPFEVEVLSLPPRKWKWRMRLGAPYFASLLRKDGRRFDRIVCSPFLDVAAFRGLAPNWVREVPLLVYFHENQFVYPVQAEKEWDLHFPLTNMTTALAADSLAFNSAYNLESFLAGIKGISRHTTDMALGDTAAGVRDKARVLHLGVDFSDIDKALDGREEVKGGGSQVGPAVLWNHRWEHDKGPEEFFRALMELDAEGVEFRLIVLGQSFERRPPVFEEARERLAPRVLHFGYLPDRAGYVRWLTRGDVAVSTSQHEFFGVSAVEAARAGCRPLLPRRLSYPELFPEKYLYPEGGFKAALKEALGGPGRLATEEALRLTEPYSWTTLRDNYINWIEGA